jgi:ribonuclease G
MSYVKKIIVNKEHNETRVAVLENNKLSEYFVERTEEASNVGNIYKGIVNAVIPGIQASFVNVGLEKDGFLHVSDVCSKKLDIEIDEDDFDLEKYKRESRKNKLSIDNLLKSGDDIVVQVEKDPIARKGVRLTTYVSMPGKFVVLMPNVKHKGISRKITDKEERARLKDILKSTKVLNDYGCVVRTVAQGKKQKEIVNEIKHLVKIWQEIVKKEQKIDAPAALKEEGDLVSRVVRDYFTESVNELIIDDKAEFTKIVKYLKKILPDMAKKVKFYSLEEPIFEYFKIEKSIEKLYKKNVYLKCGGHLVIEQTEALIAIDVNTGKHIGGSDFEKTVFKTNMEAAEEIPRQLRLRDVGGIIIVDFIDMKSKKNQLEVYNNLNRFLRKDRSKTDILQISKMGLLEMTRQRRGSGLYESLHDYCPYCEGTGHVKSVMSISLDVLRKIKKLFLTSSENDFVVYLHPKVVDRLLGEDRGHLDVLEKHFRKRIDIRNDIDSHIEGVRFISGVSKKPLEI